MSFDVQIIQRFHITCHNRFLLIFFKEKESTVYDNYRTFYLQKLKTAVISY